jgi:alpha-glutamyl/putrescinyl thymine pyrophosphorylase clade 1
VKFWGAAYMQKPQTGSDLIGKHNNYLDLLERMMRSSITEGLLSASTYEQAFRVLRTFPSPAMGDFTAMQLLTDINYSPVLSFSENDFIVPGPGCLRGMQKCFGRPVSVPEAQGIIYNFVDEQETYFKELGYEPVTLFDRRLHAIDVQNLFCETDKYSRVAHPEFKLKANERIKATFKPVDRPLPAPFFPPKWKLQGK